jgi:hypothetical protein
MRIEWIESLDPVSGAPSYFVSAHWTLVQVEASFTYNPNLGIPSTYYFATYFTDILLAHAD